MNKKFLLFFCVFIWLTSSLVCCSNSEAPENPDSDLIEISETPIDSFPEVEDSIPEKPTMDGMLQLSGGSVTLGTNEKKFKESERPAMKVVLDYEFFLGIHEVTCGEYATVAKKAKLKTFGKCKNDSIPLTDISYYDAILYANAKSKLDGYDTAYTYGKPTYDTEGHCTYLEGFAFHPDVKAFRLPTEAEWVYAATRAWNVKKSRNNSNSGYRLHAACSKGPDSTGFCDMAGNAMEWANDWMGAFRDTTVTNYVGAPDGGEMGERIVKGGCYSSSETELNPYSRGDVYTVTSSTRAEYVGFRLAFGSIPDALWMGDDGETQTSVVTSLASQETVKGLTGSYNVKLTFRNDVTGNIAYIDYLNGSLSVKEITKGIDAYHPEISPNGSWVAFCTGMEGVSGKSTIYVQSLDEDSTIRVKLGSNGAAIPRWRALDNGDTVIVYVSDAGNNKDDATFKSTSTWQVKFSNGKFGKPKKLFDGAYHGGISEDEKLAVSGARLLRARVSGKDKVWYNGEQACNASLAQDGTKRTAFLDFGGKTGREFAGSNYATHQRILIADGNGKLLQTIEAPGGYTFDHTEWATNGERSIVVATLTNVNGAHTKIVLVDPDGNGVTELAEGEELWHPNLWVKKKTVKPHSSSSADKSTSSDTKSSSSSGDSATSTGGDDNGSSSSETEIPPEEEFELNLDSAGMYYNTSGAHAKADQWRYKMEFLWNYKDTANIVIIGSSRTYYGVNPLLFKDPFYAINLAVATNPQGGSYLLLTNYVLPHISKLKIVITSIDIDLWYFTGNGIFGNAYKSYPGYVYDKNHDYWKNNYPAGLAEATFDSPGVVTTRNNLRPTRGFYAASPQGWGEPSLSGDSTWMDKNHDEYYHNFDILVKMIKKCQDKGVILIGVITPQNPLYTETDAFASHGIRRSEAPDLIEEIKNLSNTYPNFILMDEYKMGYHDYTDEMALDTDHLAAKGAEQLTKRVLALIKKLDAESEP